MASSAIRALVDQLADLELEEVPCPKRVLAALRSVPGARHHRGVRPPIVGILAIAVCAVAAGARSFAAIAEWAAETAASLLHEAGTGTPRAAAIGRVLMSMDADALDAALGRWARAATSPAIMAVDGDEVRGAKNGGGSTVHLLSALDHVFSTVAAQVEGRLRLSPQRSRTRAADLSHSRRSSRRCAHRPGSHGPAARHVLHQRRHHRPGPARRGAHRTRGESPARRRPGKNECRNRRGTPHQHQHRQVPPCPSHDQARNPESGRTGHEGL